jgi:hypothetical protein
LKCCFHSLFTFYVEWKVFLQGGFSFLGIGNWSGEYGDLKPSIVILGQTLLHQKRLMSWFIVVVEQPVSVFLMWGCLWKTASHRWWRVSVWGSTVFT